MRTFLFLTTIISVVAVVSATTQGWVDDGVRKQTMCLASQLGTGGSSYCNGYGQASAGEIFTLGDDGYSISVQNGIVYAVFDSSDGSDWFGSDGNLNCGTLPQASLSQTSSYFGGASAIHNGFATGWDALDNSFVADLASKLSSSCQGCRVVVGGHSRGGAFATLAMHTLLLDTSLNGDADLGHLRTNPSANLFVMTFGEPHVLKHSAVKTSSDWTGTIAPLQNTIKERHVVWGYVAGFCSFADPVSYASDICLNSFEPTGMLVSSCDGAGTFHGLDAHYIWRMFNKGEVEKFFHKCWGGSTSTGHAEKKCWHYLSWFRWYFKCDYLSGRNRSNNEGAMTNRYQDWLEQSCPSNIANI